MQLLMLMSNIRFIFHENQVSMVEIFACKGILMHPWAMTILMTSLDAAFDRL